MSTRSSSPARPSPQVADELDRSAAQECGRTIVSLATSAQLPLALVGGKAQSLGRLLSLGFAVPRGLVITTDAYREHLATATAGRDLKALASTPKARGRVQEAIRNQPLADALVQELSAAVACHCTAPLSVAVRSSAVCEDGAVASFAGQFESYLEISSPQDLADAIRRCWASAWEERVASYASRSSQAGTEIAVVVQDMVHASRSGVLFTINPVTGDENQFLVESVVGLADDLVSGHVDGESTILCAHTGEIQDSQSSALASHLAAELHRTARRAQEEWGQPVDIEWCFDGTLKLVQVRPVTSVGHDPDLGEWTTADFREGGVSSDTCSSFMWSLYRLAMNESMPEYFKEIRLIKKDYEAEWIRLFYCRPYWSASEVKRALKRIPGYSEDSFDRDLGIEPDASVPGETTPTTVRTVLGILPTLFALKRNYRTRLRKNHKLAAEFTQRAEPFALTREQLKALPRAEFVQRYRTLIEDFYRLVETSYFKTIYNTANAKLELGSALQKAEKATGLKLDDLALVSGLRDLSHLRPVRDLHQLAEKIRSGEIALDDAVVRDYASRWAHHSRKELDIRVPRWDEDLDFVRSMLENAVEHAQGGARQRDSEATQIACHEREVQRTRRILRRRPLLRQTVLKKLRLTRDYMWWREEMRDYSSRCYHLVRRWALEAERRLLAEGVLSESGDIWHLEALEVADVLDGTQTAQEARKLVDRRAHHERCYRNFACPGEVGTRASARPALPPATNGDLVGTGCSSGTVTGIARVVESLADLKLIQPGEILVTRFTDPGWTPAFAHIGAVVTETGGVLSHAAVISREYGIPAVLGVAGATRDIRSGSHIQVDGDRGLISVIGG